MSIPIEPKEMYYIAQSSYQVGLENAKKYISQNAPTFRVIDQFDIGHVSGTIKKIAKRAFQLLFKPSGIQGSWRVTFLQKEGTNKFWVSIEGTSSFANGIADIKNQIHSGNARPITDQIAAHIKRIAQEKGLELEGFSSHSAGVLLGKRTIKDHFNHASIWQMGINAQRAPRGENVIMLRSPNDIVTHVSGVKNRSFKLPIPKQNNTFGAHKLDNCEAMTQLQWSEIDPSLAPPPSPQVQNVPTATATQNPQIVESPKGSQVTESTNVSNEVPSTDLRNRVLANGAGLLTGYAATEAFVVKRENAYPHQNATIRGSALGAGMVAVIINLWKKYAPVPSFLISAGATLSGGIVARVVTDHTMAPEQPSTSMKFHFAWSHRWVKAVFLKSVETLGETKRGGATCETLGCRHRHLQGGGMLGARLGARLGDPYHIYETIEVNSLSQKAVLAVAKVVDEYVNFFSTPVGTVKRWFGK